MNGTMPVNELNVWTCSLDDENSWELRHTTFNYDEALRVARELDQGETISTIYETAQLLVDGRPETDALLFWWNAN